MAGAPASTRPVWPATDDRECCTARSPSSAGLDYPAVGPEHAFWHSSGRVSYTRIDDRDALGAFRLLAETEGIIPALESAHALAYAVKVAPAMALGDRILVNLSGRGDKDLEEVARLEGRAP